MNDMKNLINRASCPDEIKIIRYALHQCSEEESDKIKEHLLKCPWCFEEFASFIKEEEIESEDTTDEFIPKHLDIKKLKERIQKKLIIILQLNFITETIKKWEIVHQNADIFHPRKIRLKRGEIDIELPPLQFLKNFNGYQVKVDINNKEKDLFDLHVTVIKKEDESPVANITFSFIDEKKQITLKEYTEEDGTHLFTEINPGEYSIKLIKDDVLIGTIQLDLKGS